MRLMVKEEGRSTQSVTLPYPWSEDSIAPALGRICEIFRRYVEGDRVLVKASSEVETASNKQKVDWPMVKAEYRETRQNASHQTWKSKHEKVIDQAIYLLS
jgi:hypothetical protein